MSESALPNLTCSVGLAGLVGQIYGETAPSKTGVEVIGQSMNNYAINVFFVERNESVWVVPELLEFVDHASGTEFQIEGASEKFVRDAKGEWVKISAQYSKPWWKFWWR